MMEKKIMILAAEALLLLTMTACSKNNAISSTNEGDNPISENSEQTIGKVMFDSTVFSGKIKGCYYAGDNKLIVLADQLYLYDTELNKVLASMEISLNDLVVQSYNTGYLISGYDDNGVNAILCSADFSKKEDLKLYELLIDDSILSPNGIDISEDGNTLAIAGFGGIYLYDVNDKNVTMFFAVDEHAISNNMQVSWIEQIHFINQDTALAFVGLAAQLPAVVDSTDKHIYGTISMSEANLTIIEPESYTVAELLAGGDRLMMPQAFDQNNGTLLVMDTNTGKETFVPFVTPEEGSNGVYISEQGNYFATAVLGSDLTIRIYETKTGSLVHTETIAHTDSTYFNRIPRVVILDEAKYCIVLLGAGIDAIDTLSAAFHFGE